MGPNREIKFRKSEKPVLRAGAHNFYLVLFSAFSYWIIFMCVNMLYGYNMPLFYFVFIFVLIWNIRGYLRVTSKIVLKSNEKLIFVCSLYSIEYELDDIKEVDFRCMDLATKNVFHVMVKSNKRFIKIFRCSIGLSFINDLKEIQSEAIDFFESLFEKEEVTSYYFKFKPRRK